MAQVLTSNQSFPFSSFPLPSSFSPFVMFSIVFISDFSDAGIAVGGDERIREGPVVYYEEYDGGHFGCERRFDHSIPMLVTALHMQELHDKAKKAITNT